MKQRYTGLLLLFLLTAIFSGCSILTDNQQIAPIKGAYAPDFTLTTLSGEEVSLRDYQGKPVLINFWATWCGPCRLEMPAIQESYTEHEQNLVVLAVNLAESPEKVSAFVAELGLTFDPLLDKEGSIFELYEVRGYPSSYFIDESGMIQVIHIGFLTADQLEHNLAVIGLEKSVSQAP